MEKPQTLSEKTSLLRDKAARALRLAVGLTSPDQERLTQFAEELREEATDLEQRAAAEASTTITKR